MNSSSPNRSVPQGAKAKISAPYVASTTHFVIQSVPVKFRTARNLKKAADLKFGIGKLIVTLYSTWID